MKGKTLIFSILLVFEIGLIIFFGLKFHRLGCKINDFFVDSQKIIADLSALDRIDFEKYSTSLYLFIVVISTVGTSVVLSVGKEVEPKKKKIAPLKKGSKESNFLIDPKEVLKQKQQREKILEELKEKQDKKNAKEIDDKKAAKKKEDLSKAKENSNIKSENSADKNSGENIEELVHESGSQQAEALRGEPKSEISKTASQSVDNALIEENQSSTKSENKEGFLNKAESGSFEDETFHSQTFENIVLPSISAEQEEFLSKQPLFEYIDFKSEFESVKAELLDTEPIYGPGEDEKSTYDEEGFHEFYARHSGGLSKSSNPIENQSQEETEKRLRQVIREEVYGLVDQTSVKMSENYERLNQIMREIVSLRDEIKVIRNDQDLPLEEQEEELNPRLKMLKEMEAEGQLVMSDIEDTQRMEAQRMYGRYSLV